MKIWVEGPAGNAGPGQMNLFSTGENVLEFWKQNKCTGIGELQERLVRENATECLECYMPRPGPPSFEIRHAFLIEVDRFYTSGEWKGDNNGNPQ